MIGHQKGDRYEQYTIIGQDTKDQHAFTQQQFKQSSL